MVHPLRRESFYWVFVLALVSLMFVRLPPMAAKQETILGTYRTLVEVDALARRQYVEPIHDDRLVDGAIRGMMLQLDPYSGYISPAELPDFERRSAGDYVGLGIEIGFADGQPTVIAAVEGSPAARGGLITGDVLLAINGREVEGSSLIDLKRTLHGESADPVRLRVRRPTHQDPIDILVVPGPVSLQTVRGFRRAPDGRWDYLLDPDHRIGYVRISSFYETTTAALREALDHLRRLGAEALILDLRFNPGGRLEQAVSVSDCFLSSGLILSTVTRRLAVQEYSATADPCDCAWKLVVLINSGSASASEIVAGALQDHGRAVLVGERTFGKGSVQHLLRLQTSDGAIKLTTALYRLPGGRIIHRHAYDARSAAWGILPDVEVPLTRDEQTAIQQSRLALDRAAEPAQPGDDRAPAELPRDRQWDVALALLRSAQSDSQR